MFKKIRRIAIFITILLSIMIIIGIMFVLDGVGIIDLGGSNSISNSSTTVITDEKIKAIYEEFKRNEDKPYIMDHSNLQYDQCMDYYDCSSWVIHCLAHTGIKKLPDLTAQGIYARCEKVDANDRQPGDLIFLQKTYNTSDTVTHVAIYLGQMIIDGDSGEWIIESAGSSTGMKISKYDSGRWTGEHFYAFGRLKSE